MSDNLNGCPTNSNGKRSAGGESPIDDQDAEYIVEKIVGKSFLDGRPQVLVKWQGYPIEQSTWEPLEEMDKCLDLVSDYEQQLFYDCQEKAKIERELVGASKQSEGSSVQATQVKIVNEQPDPLLPTTSFGGSPTKFTTQGLPPFPVLVKQEDQEYPMVSLTQEKQLTTVEEEDQVSVHLVKQEDQDYPTTFSSVQEKQQNIVEEGDQGLPTTSSGRKTAWGSNQPWNGKKKGKYGKNKAKLAKKSKAASTQQKPTTMDVGSEEDEDLKNSMPVASGKGAKPKKLKLASAKETSDETLGAAAPFPLARCSASAACFDALNALPDLEQMTIKDPDQIKIDQLLAELDDRLSRPAGNFFKLSRGRGNGGRNGRGGRRAAGNPWNQPYQGVFGLDRGLEMEKVEHSFKILDFHFLFVTWKGCPEMDTVTLPSVRYLYPQLVIDYLETLKRKRR
nr:uncharacterized protein LOC108014933 [Drosophila suzukii]